MIDAGEPHHPPTHVVGEDETLEQARRQLTLLQRRIQVEEALERVRARAMAMHTSDELTRVAEVCFEQLGGLEIPALRRVVIFVMNPDEDTTSFWASSESDQPGTNRVTVPMRENATFREITERWLALEDRFTIFFEGQTLKDFITYIVQNGWRYPAGESRADRMVMHFASYSHGALSAATYESITDEDFDILARFAKVFEQTYTRFLDLKKAEEQAREAQIEAALERVRSRAMAMHHADESAETAAVLFQQLEELGIEPWRCGITIVDDETKTFEIWSVTNSAEDKRVVVIGQTKLMDHPIVRGLYTAWKQQGPGHIYDLCGEALQDYLSYITRDFPLPEADAPTEELPERLVYYHALFAQGTLYGAFLHPLPEAQVHVLQRFAKVFEQTYTRFLDLKKAEEQAREAQIEGALERVRAKAMAMNSSHDISDAMAIVFSELERLGIVTLRCGIAIIHETKDCDVWTATSKGEEKDVRVIGRLDMTIHPLLEGVFKAWKEQQPFYLYELAGQDRHNGFPPI